MMKLKEFFKTRKNKIKMFISDYAEKNPKKIAKLGTIINYGFTALFLSVPVYTFLFLKYQTNPKIIPLIILSFWCFIPFMEYYYIWFRELWKDDLKEK